MLSHVYEIEGLLLVAQRQGGDTPGVIKDKISRKVRELAQMLDAAEQPVEPEPEGLPSDDYDPNETWQHDNGVEPSEVFAIDYQEPQHQQVEPEPAEVPVADREPDEDISVEFIEADEPEEDEADVYEAAPAAGEPLRVDEKLQRTMSKDLRKAFSLNDRFRFRRELFGNDEAAMNEALDRIESMNTHLDAEHYFYNLLGWKRDDEVVKEFMQIVSNHFHK